MYKIAKQFDFCYGHRVWSQSLNVEYSLDNCLKCRHLHGHQGTVVVYLEADELKDGMITDFKHLNWFKKWLDDVLDHKFIMDINDPLRTIQFPLSVDNLQFNEENDYWVVNREFFKSTIQPIQELYEGLVLVNFVPTSENLSKWIFDIIEKKMSKINIKVSQVQFFETPKSQSNYYV
jgi:6-pyruvoyltetrahydropterin/6-carboxytetrahydropterin synthase